MRSPLQPRIHPAAAGCEPWASFLEPQFLHPNVTIGQCVSDLELMAKVYEPVDMANRVEHLPLK